MLYLLIPVRIVIKPITHIVPGYLTILIENNFIVEEYTEKSPCVRTHSQNSKRISLLSPQRACKRCTLYGWDQLVLRIRCTDNWLKFSPWLTLLIDSRGLPTTFAKTTMNVFPSVRHFGPLYVLRSAAEPVSWNRLIKWQTVVCSSIVLA